MLGLGMHLQVVEGDAGHLGPGLADALPISILYVKLGLLTVVVVVCRWGKCFCCCSCRSNVAKH